MGKYNEVVQFSIIVLKKLKDLNNQIVMALNTCLHFLLKLKL